MCAGTNDVWQTQAPATRRTRRVVAPRRSTSRGRGPCGAQATAGKSRAARGAPRGMRRDAGISPIRRVLPCGHAPHGWFSPGASQTSLFCRALLVSQRLPVAIQAYWGAWSGVATPVRRSRRAGPLGVLRRPRAASSAAARHTHRRGAAALDHASLLVICAGRPAPRLIIFLNVFVCKNRSWNDVVRGEVSELV